MLKGDRVLVVVGPQGNARLVQVTLAENAGKCQARVVLGGRVVTTPIERVYPATTEGADEAREWTGAALAAA